MIPQRQLRRRDFLGLASVVAIGLTMAACDSEAGTSDTSKARTGAMDSFGVGDTFKATAPLTFSFLFSDQPTYPYKKDWLLWQKLWIEAFLALAAGIALGVLGEAAGFGLAGTGLSLLVGLYVGLEGSALRVNALRRRGWREWGVVEADTEAEAEIRYLVEVAGGDPEPSVRQQPPAPLSTPRASSAAPAGLALGLLHYPGKT